MVTMQEFHLMCICFQVVSIISTIQCAFNYSSINLPDDHLEIYFAQHPSIAQQCVEDPVCPFRHLIHENGHKCWGYENDCTLQSQTARPRCGGDHRGWVTSKQHQEATFYAQADFGYVRQQMDENQMICEPMFLHDSSLECSKHMRFCRGRNILLNFTDFAARQDPIRYQMDVLKRGEIAGYCKLHESRLTEETDHLSPLQSWAPELRFFTALPTSLDERNCDVIVTKPTFLMKIDAMNMYHHFCDFVNLYASQHLNATHAESFTQDVNILIWETYTYQSTFRSVFDAFTHNEIWDLKTFRGKVVCFRNLLFPLLPRMIFGLYYNTPLIYGCEDSTLFKAFAEHILHRLRIIRAPRLNNNIRVTFLSRGTRYRNVMNEDELLKAVEYIDGVTVQKVVFNRKVSFKKQLQIVSNTDIFIGMHGAGLTHLFFLPDWAVLFELYNCEDANCYADLTRLRGLKYITWEKEELVQRHVDVNDEENEHAAHAKFANYSFNVEEFVRLVKRSVKYVSQHKEFQKEIGEFSNTGTVQVLDFNEHIDGMDGEFARFAEERKRLKHEL